MSDDEDGAGEDILDKAKSHAKNSEKAIKSFALDNSERQHCQNIAVLGPNYLITLGWRLKDIERFLERKDVITELKILQNQYGDREGIQERTQFFAQMKINQMVPIALGVLARGLRGTVIDKTTGQIKERPPERVQMDAALEVLTRANIQGTKFKGNDKQPIIDAQQINIFGDVDTSSQALPPAARDKIRKLFNKVRANAIADTKLERRLAQEKEEAETIDADVESIKSERDTDTGDVESDD